ncbi:nucleotide-binding domain-containing protein [Biscogniauxia marginata]|nr:nucleotide-binding domain-containing protein [Biscogniauxia marginata]
MTATNGATVILGAGIIGTSTAYYLSKHQPPSTIHLVEPSPTLFASASGYSGGFLAKDWFAPAVAALGALSFEEHRKLAEKEDGARKWGYTRSTSVSYAPSLGTDLRSGRDGCGGAAVADVWCREGGSRAAVASGSGDSTVADGLAPTWLKRVEGDEVAIISEEGTVAQVDPLQLSEFLLQKCLDAGVRLHHPAKAISIHTDMRDELASVRIADTRSSTETDVPCTSIVIAAGAWSPQVFATLFPRSDLKLPISSLAGHSLVVRQPGWWSQELEDRQGCHALFVADHRPGYSPEIFSRAGGSIYVAGLNSATEPLPPLPTDAKGNISRSAIDTLRETARDVLLGRADGNKNAGDGDGDGIEILREGLCFRPVTDRGTPILGRIPDERLGVGVATRAGADGGVYLAAGHGPWGISMSLGTGKVMTEMVQGRKLSVDVSGLALGG